MKVIVGMSGGVDSSVAAFLLKQQGYEVIGVHFSLTDCGAASADALSVCDKLGIPLLFEDFSAIFAEKVFAPFVEGYRTGETPNLCVGCNKNIKFGAMFDVCKRLGADYVATGHYCKIVRVNGEFCLAEPMDGEKDQTYFLNQINGERLKMTLFPLSDLTKAEVRAIAEREGFCTAHKKGSSDVCLMGDLSLKEFLSPYVSEKQGDIVDEHGKLLGKHCGIHSYTVGQRKGLGIGGVKGYEGRYFVLKKDYANNRLIVSAGEGDALFCSSVTVGGVNFIGAAMPNSFECFAKIRYRQNKSAAKVALMGGGLAKVEFSEPQRAAAVGQFCVFYKDGLCLGGGKIINTD